MPFDVRVGRGGGLSMMRGIAGLANRRSRAMLPRSRAPMVSVNGWGRGLPHPLVWRVGW